MRGDQLAISAAKWDDPTPVEALLMRTIGRDRRQHRIEVLGVRDRKLDDAQPVTQRHRQQIDAIGSCRVRHVREIKIRLESRIGTAQRD